MVAAFRSRSSFKSTEQVIEIQAGDKEWKIDITGKSGKEIDELIKDVRGEIEAGASEPGKDRPNPDIARDADAAGTD